MCSPCHGVYPITQTNRSPAAWLATIDNMEARGAKGSDADFHDVADYLSKNFGVAVSGTIRINKAGSRSLTDFFKLFPEQADAIANFRGQNGPFRQWQDPKKVSGLDASKIEAETDKIDFN